MQNQITVPKLIDMYQCLVLHCVSRSESDKAKLSELPQKNVYDQQRKLKETTIVKTPVIDKAQSTWLVHPKIYSDNHTVIVNYQNSISIHIYYRKELMKCPKLSYILIFRIKLRNILRDCFLNPKWRGCGPTVEAFYCSRRQFFTLFAKRN